MSEKFNPKYELEKIREGPKAERPAKVAALKERMAEQQEGLAFVQERITRIIRRNPDLSHEELMRIFDTIAKPHAPSGEQQFIADSVLKRYVDRHALIRKVREDHPDDADLFHTLFGREPVGEIEIIEDPASLYVRCHDARDYALIHSRKFGDDTAVTEHDLSAADMSFGVSIGGALVPDLDCIIAENTSVIEKAYGDTPEQLTTQSNRVHTHEEQHAIKRLFRTPKTRVPYRPNVYNHEGEAGLTLFADFLSGERALIEDRARDEILAYFREGRAPAEIWAILTQPREEDGLYDYLADVRRDIKSSIQQGFDPITGHALQLNKVETKALLEMTDRILVEEYAELLKDGIRAYWRLQVSARWTDNMIIGLLVHEPLSRWKKVVDRILAAKTERQPKD